MSRPITASKNSTEVARAAELTFVSGKYNKKYNVTQEAGELVVEWNVEPFISDIPADTLFYPAGKLLCCRVSYYSYTFHNTYHYESIRHSSYR